MKSLLQAAWQLCVAIGDLIVVIVAQTQLMPTQVSPCCVLPVSSAHISAICKLFGHGVQKLVTNNTA